MLLQQALHDCLVDFNRIILVTDLIEEYNLTAIEVNDQLNTYLAAEEKMGKKFIKCYLVHGLEKQSETNVINEIHTIVEGEDKLSETLGQLKTGEYNLYSVEYDGGAKSLPRTLKIMQNFPVQMLNVEKRAITGNKLSNDAAAASIVENAPEKENIQMKTEAAATKSSSNKAEGGKQRGGMNNFFTAASATTVVKTEPNTRKETKTTEPASPKKTQDFFKKQTETIATNKITTTIQQEAKITKKSSTSKNVKDFFKRPIESRVSKPTPAAATAATEKVEKQDVKTNTSVMLFESDEDDNTSTDEEDTLEILRRTIITNEPEEEASTGGIKRRRIIDSDDDDVDDNDTADASGQKQKQESDTTTSTEMEITEEQQSETYLDDDGFVITIKPSKTNAHKKRVAQTNAAASKKTKSEPIIGKTASPSSAEKNTTKAIVGKAATAAKTKQGTIMNFFTKV